MIIKDKEFGQFDVNLEDDGTIDTVVSVYHEKHERKDIRFSQEHGANFRSDDGAIYDDAFEELAQEAVEAYIERYLI